MLTLLPVHTTIYQLFKPSHYFIISRVLLSELSQLKTCQVRHLQIIEELEVARSLGSFLDGLAQGHSTGASIGPVGGAHGVESTRRLGHAADQVQLGLSIRPARGQRKIL